MLEITESVAASVQASVNQNDLKNIVANPVNTELLPIVIVGTGYAGYGLAKALRERNPEQPIIMFSNDNGDHYSKPALSNALARDKEADHLILETLMEVEQRLSIRIYANCQVQGIDQQQHLVHSAMGVVKYAKLVLAQGAAPIRLGFAGTGASEVLSVNDLRDYRQFRQLLDKTDKAQNSLEATRKKTHVTIIGSGLIGCEFANDLAGKGYQVVVIGLADWAMNRLLPQEIGQQLQQKLSALGVAWQLANSVETIDKLAEQQGYLLRLADGKQLKTDIVLSAVGLKARTELAKSAGVACDSAIIVNGGLRTNVQDIYALGDCAQIQGRLQPFIAPINHSIQALANCLIGKPTMAQYPLMPVIVKTPAFAITLLSPLPEQFAQGSWKIESNTSEGVSSMRGLFVDEQGQLLGFVLTGECVNERQQWLDKVVR
ncbi:MAG: FAD-dependent oxidoreductase [Oceanospirillaceae bacterium]